MSAPEVVVAPGQRVDPGLEDVRRRHLGREGAIRAIGALDYLCGGLSLLASLGCILLLRHHLRLGPNPQGLLFPLLVEAGRMADALGLAWLLGAPHRRPNSFAFANAAFAEAYLSAMALAHLALAGASFAVGYGLRRLRGWARRAQVALAAALAALVASSCVLGASEGSLPGVAVALLPAAWLASLLASPRGRMVFSPGYRQVRAGTRHLRPKSALWVAMGLIPLALGILVLVDWSTIRVAVAIKRLVG